MAQRLLTVLVVLVGLTAGSVSPVSASVGPAVQILSPLAGSTISGVTVFELLVTHDDPLGVRWARVSLNGNTRVVEAPVPSTGCSDGCHVTLAVDTVSAVGSPRTTSYVLPDADTLVQAWTGAPGVTGGEVYQHVVVDNQRPTLVLDAAQNDSWSTGTQYPYTAGDSLVLAASVTTTSGSPVTAVDWIGDNQTRPTSFVPAADARWTANVDTSALAESTRFSTVVAEDARGVSSLPVSAGYLVLRGFTLTAPAVPVPVVDESLFTLQVSYAYSRTFPDTRPARVQTFVDGVRTGDAQLCCAPMGSSGVVRPYLGTAATAGEHVVSVVVSDNRGRTAGVEFPVTVESSVTSSVTTGAGASVVAGHPLQLTGRITTTRSPVHAWWTEVDGVPSSSRTCEASCADLPVSWTFESTRPGPRTVALVSMTRAGLTYRASTTVTVLPFLPANPMIGPGRWVGHGGNDVLTRRPGGVLWVQQGVGNGTLDQGWKVGHGWDGFTAIVGPGDLTGDRNVDLLARDANGALWLYPTNGSGGVLKRRLVGSGWNGLTVLAPGDLTGDRRSDLLARDGLGRLWLYPGTGTGGFLTRRLVGTGWAASFDVITPGDWNGDGHRDLQARDASGALWLFPGTGKGTFGRASRIGSGWSVFDVVIGPGDMNADGRADLYARDATGAVWFYPGDGRGGFTARRLASSGW